MPGIRGYAALSKQFGGRGMASDGAVPRGAVPANGNAPTALVGVYATGLTSTQVSFRWTGGGSYSGGNPFWIASTEYGPNGLNAPNKSGYTLTPSSNGTDIGVITVTGLTAATSYTFYVWVSDDFGDGPWVSVNVTTP